MKNAQKKPTQLEPTPLALVMSGNHHKVETMPEEQRPRGDFCHIESFRPGRQQTGAPKKDFWGEVIET